MSDVSADLRAYLELLERVPDVYRRAWDAIAIYDLEGRVVGGNNAARRLIGDAFAVSLVSRGAHFSSHLPMNDAAAAARTFAQVVTKGESVDNETSFRDVDGSPIPVTVRLVRRASTVIVGVTALRAISARSWCRGAVHPSEQQFGRFSRITPMIMLLDLQARFTRVNAGAVGSRVQH